MTNRICLGYQPSTSGWGLKTSLVGKNVLTVTDPNDLSFDSNWSELIGVITQGSAYANSSDVVSGYYLLASFPTQSRPPNTWIQEGYSTNSTGPLGIKITTNELRVRAGDESTGYSCPTNLIAYAIFKSALI